MPLTFVAWQGAAHFRKISGFASEPAFYFGEHEMTKHIQNWLSNNNEC